MGGASVAIADLSAGLA